MRSLRALFFAAAAIAGLVVVVVSVLGRRRSSEAAPVLTVSSPLAFASPSRRVERWRHVRFALGRASVASVAVTLGLTVLVASSNDATVDRTPLASAADDDTSSSLTSIGPTPDLIVQTGSGEGDLYGSLVPGDVAIGGDQPTGPADVEGGDRPENSGAEADLLLLRDDLENTITAYQSQVGGIDVAIAVTDLQ
ncbi:MAG: hypothetical protein ACE5FA_01595, partial [Dehalococcoidia bacterium]